MKILLFIIERKLSGKNASLNFTLPSTVFHASVFQLKDFIFHLCKLLFLKLFWLITPYGKNTSKFLKIFFLANPCQLFFNLADHHVVLGHTTHPNPLRTIHSELYIYQKFHLSVEFRLERICALWCRVRRTKTNSLHFLAAV